MNLLLSPHNDDEALFASYVCLRERPLVITCLDGGRKAHYATPEARVAESADAMKVLGCDHAHLWMAIDQSDWEGIERRLTMVAPDAPAKVWAPLPEPGGHRHHNGLGSLALKLWPDRVSFYSTYHMVDGWPVRSTHGVETPVEDGWPELKRQALACYPSQANAEGTAMHFERPLFEYTVDRIRLNLGGGINPIAGFVNLDKSDGWRFEDGLECYPDGTVDAITVSHTLMYVPPELWPFAFAEMARVLRPGGTLRITEDAIGGPGSGRPVIRPNAAVATTPELVLEHLAAVGLHGRVVAAAETDFIDGSLIQENYGAAPDVFHAEATKLAEITEMAA